MYSMGVARRFFCSGACTVRSMLHKTGNGAIQTTLGAPPCRTGSRSVFWNYYPKPLENLGLKACCTRTFLGLSFATSFLAAEQGAVRFDNDKGVYDGFQGTQQAPEITEIIAEDSSELEAQHKLLNFIKRYWWPTVFLLTVIVGYPYPKSLLPNTVLLMWSTKPNPGSIYLWLKKLNSAATVMHVEVKDYMFFCLAKVTYLTSNATMVGLLGDWWIVYSSSSRITALGLSTSFASPAITVDNGLDNVPNLDNLAKEFRSKKEELETEFKKVTEDGLKKYKTWLKKVCNAHCLFLQYVGLNSTANGLPCPRSGLKYICFRHQ